MEAAFQRSSLGEGDRREGTPAQPHAQETIASKAMRFRITSVDPSSRINCFFLKSLNRRVTVSLDAPIICAISSCVRPELTRISLVLFAEGGVQESSNFANFPADERARIRS